MGIKNGGLPVLPQTGDTYNGALIPGTASSGNFSGGSNREVGAFAGDINVNAGSDELVLSVSDLSPCRPPLDAFYLHIAGKDNLVSCSDIFLQVWGLLLLSFHCRKMLSFFLDPLWRFLM